jgi:hypothetical protein
MNSTDTLRPLSMVSPLAQRTEGGSTAKTISIKGVLVRLSQSFKLTFPPFRYRTARDHTTQDLPEAVSSRVYHRRYITSDEEDKGEEEWHHLDRHSVSVGEYSPFYTRKLNSLSDGDDHSELVVKVFRKHRIGKNKLVGSLSDTIGTVLGKCTADNGTISFYIVAFY